MEEIKKPQLKPIGSIVGIGGKREVHAYLNHIFAVIGFEKDTEGLAAFAKYKGIIDDKELKISFSIFKTTHYKGFGVDHFVRYRRFQGLRMKTDVPLNVDTRLVIAKQTIGKWLKRFTNMAMKLKQFKLIDNNYFDKELYSPDEFYAQQIIDDNEIKQIICKLTQKEAKVLSWGVIQIPGKLTLGITFSDLSDFDEDTLLKRFEYICKLAHLFDTKTVTKALEPTKIEFMSRKHPNKSLQKGLLMVLLFILLGLSVIGLLFFITVKFGQWPVFILAITAYIIYKKI